MELRHIRWSIAGSTSNFKMNLTFSICRSQWHLFRVRVSCAAHKKAAVPLKKNSKYPSPKCSFSENLCIMKQRMLIGPVSVFTLPVKATLF